jgi:hypothetical protein
MKFLLAVFFSLFFSVLHGQQTTNVLRAFPLVNINYINGTTFNDYSLKNISHIDVEGITFFKGTD